MVIMMVMMQIQKFHLTIQLKKMKFLTMNQLHQHLPLKVTKSVRIVGARIKGMDEDVGTLDVVGKIQDVGVISNHGGEGHPSRTVATNYQSAGVK